MLRLFFSLILGTLFGITLTKSQVISWYEIQDMFYFRSPHLYLIIGSAVFTGALSLQILKKLRARSVYHNPINYKTKPDHRGIIIGGFIFGIGWFITGACPGPIYAQIGSTAWPALFTLMGALLGTFLYGLLKRKLPH